jgi:hypothetical protein
MAAGRSIKGHLSLFSVVIKKKGISPVFGVDAKSIKYYKVS